MIALADSAATSCQCPPLKPMWKSLKMCQPPLAPPPISIFRFKKRARENPFLCFVSVIFGTAPLRINEWIIKKLIYKSKRQMMKKTINALNPSFSVSSHRCSLDSTSTLHLLCKLSIALLDFLGICLFSVCFSWVDANLPNAIKPRPKEKIRMFPRIRNTYVHWLQIQRSRKRHCMTLKRQNDWGEIRE